jgi:D-alanyl-D-alanine carboxypeptidase
MEKHPIDYLILVNPFHKIPEDFVDKLELVEMKGYDDEVFRVEKEAARQFCGLQAAAAEKGIEILLSSAYRSVEKQRAIKEEFTAEYGVDYAKRYVAKPGCSEHHTGLALDFVAKIGGKWLIESDEIIERAGELKPVYDLLPRFGFILRYLKGKEAITGYPAEPWHIRYVGDAEVAAEIAERGITLEEYCEMQSAKVMQLI